jgi:hypothetical protein
MTFKTLFPAVLKGEHSLIYIYIYIYIVSISHFLIMQELLSLVLLFEEERKDRKGSQIIFLCFIINYAEGEKRSCTGC